MTEDVRVARVEPREGGWYGIPLRSGGFATGVIARLSGRGIALGYFFGPRREQPPGVEDLRDLRASEAVLVCRFGTVGIEDGDWPRVGQQDQWNRREYSTPVFLHQEALTGRWRASVYDDDDPTIHVRDEPLPADSEPVGPTTGMYGSAAVEIALTSLLSE